MRGVRILRTALVLVGAVAVLLLAGPSARADADDSQCLLCHGTPRTLIGAAREMAREGRGERKISTETVGEG